MPTPTLLSLPPELLIHILTFLPDLQPTSTPTTIGHKIPLTPPVCRASHALRREARLLYASSRPFAIQADADGDGGGVRVRAWIDALGDEALANVRSLQLSRHWQLPRPERGQGHVGFYVRMFRSSAGDGGVWGCEKGTYPVANDTRGLRSESVFLLREVVMRRLRRRSRRVGRGEFHGGLRRQDVEFVLRAMEIVASHAIGAFDVDQSGEGRRARRRVFERMEGLLKGLGDEGEESARQSERVFFTPY